MRPFDRNASRLDSVGMLLQKAGPAHDSILHICLG